MQSNFIISTIYLIFLLFTFKVYGNIIIDKVDIGDLDIKTTKSKIFTDYSSTTYNFTDDDKIVFIEPIKFEDIFLADTSSDLLNYMYPAGIRLPTMLLLPEDFYLDSEGLDFYTSDGTKLLRLICQNSNIDRINFTTFEINAADKYYNLMQLKSMALGLPLYSLEVTDGLLLSYTNEQQKKAKELIDDFETKFCQILFIDTSNSIYNWCELVRKHYAENIDTLITQDAILPFIIPLNSEIKNLYKAYLGLLTQLKFPDSISDFNSYIDTNYLPYSYKNFINTKLVYSIADSILSLGEFYQQLPFNREDYFMVGKVRHDDILRVNNTISRKTSKKNLSESLFPDTESNSYISVNDQLLGENCDLIKLNEDTYVSNFLLHNIFYKFCIIIIFSLSLAFVLADLIYRIKNK